MVVSRGLPEISAGIAGLSRLYLSLAKRGEATVPNCSASPFCTLPDGFEQIPILGSLADLNTDWQTRPSAHPHLRTSPAAGSVRQVPPHPATSCMRWSGGAAGSGFSASKRLNGRAA